MDPVILTDYFLIAMPSMADTFFAKTVVYICEHNEKGALGIIVNRPMEMNLLNLFERADIRLDSGSSDFSSRPVYFGGPVQTDRGFVLHRPVGEWQSTIPVNNGIGFTSSRDILQAVAAHGNPADILVTLGFSGWAAGQLEDEISANSWLTVPANPHILFETHPDFRLQAAMQSLGIDFASLSSVAGHA